MEIFKSVCKKSLLNANDLSWYSEVKQNKSIQIGLKKMCSSVKWWKEENHVWSSCYSDVFLSDIMQNISEKVSNINEHTGEKSWQSV